MREGDESDIPSKENQSKEGGGGVLKVHFINEYKSDSYNYINEDICDVEIMRGSSFSNEERELLANIDDSG